MRFHLQKILSICQFLSDFMDVIEDISNSIVEASTRLSKDKLNALKKAIEIETDDNAAWCLSQILENYEVAQDTRFPLCDDTGIAHVIIEVGCERQITGDLLNKIHKGIEPVVVLFFALSPIIYVISSKFTLNPSSKPL